MAWLALFFAGLLEVVWAVGLKHTEGFTQPIPSLVTLAAMAASLYLLSFAMRSLPLGTAYALWVGVGVVGTTIVGVVVFKEPLSLLRVISTVLLILGVFGLSLNRGGA